MKKAIFGLSVLVAFSLMTGCGGSSGGVSDADIDKAGDKLEALCENISGDFDGSDGAKLKSGGKAKFATCESDEISKIESDWKKVCSSINFHFKKIDDTIGCFEKPFNEYDFDD